MLFELFGDYKKSFFRCFWKVRFFWGEKPNKMQENGGFRKKRVKPTVGYNFGHGCGRIGPRLMKNLKL
jgi:hypothetical protein